MRINRKQLGFGALVLLVLGALTTFVALWLAWADSTLSGGVLVASVGAAALLLAGIVAQLALQLLSSSEAAAAQRLMRERTQRVERRLSEVAALTNKSHDILTRIHTDQLRRVAAFSQHTNRMVKRVNEQQLPRVLEIGAETSRFMGSASADMAQVRVAVSGDRLAAADARAIKALETLQQVIDQLISVNTENTKRVVGEVQRVTDRSSTRQLEAVVQAGRLTSQQVAGLFSIYTMLHPEAPLPPFGGWAITPDTGAYLMRSIHDRRPGLIVEAGSGLSTTLIGLALKMLGRGRLISLEHDLTYLEATAHDIERHRVEDYVELVHAPLLPVDIGGEQWIWYDLSATSIDEPVDMLVVDGPPGTIAPHARYPALPLMWQSLAPDAVIVLDDANRAQEREVVERWLKEYPECSFTQIDNDRGTAELHRNP